MKKFRKIMTSVVSLGVLLSSVPYSTSASEYDYHNGFTSEEILASEVKPKITVQSECISIDEAKSYPYRNINISVEGADQNMLQHHFTYTMTDVLK